MKVVEMYQLERKTKLKVPVFLVRAPAGFPSRTDDYVEERLDLNKRTIRHPENTFMIRVMGESMENDRIHEGDLLIVDKAIEPSHNDIILASLNGELTVKRLVKKASRWYLVAANPKYPPFEITPEMDFQILGKVTYVFHPTL